MWAARAAAHSTSWMALLELPPLCTAGPVTLRCALARYADLLSAPSKAALQALAAFASDPTEAQRLRQLASIEGKAEYHDYVTAPKRSLLQVMQEFPSAKPSLGEQWWWQFFNSFVSFRLDV